MFCVAHKVAAKLSNINRINFCFPFQMFGNWTFGTLVFTVMVITVTMKVQK